MTFSQYFATNVSKVSELIASVIIQSDDTELSLLADLIPTPEKPRFRMLLAAIEEIPQELQSKVASEVLKSICPDLNVKG